MAKCQWRDKPGGPETCGLLADAAGEYCPRHAYLRTLNATNQWDKELKQLVNRKGPAKVVDNTRRGLIESGLQFVGNGNCRGCEAPIEWWKNVNGNKVPYNPMPGENSWAKVHFATCAQADKFRNERRG